MPNYLPPKPPTPVAHVPPRISAKRKRLWARIILITILLLSGVWGDHLYAVHSQINHDRAQSAANLREIGRDLLVTATIYHGQYPYSFGGLLENGNLPPTAFIAPNSHDTPATGPTRHDIAINLDKPGHFSYVYLGQSLNSTKIPATAVIAYEFPYINNNQGGNVLFNDGHVEFLDMLAINSIQAQIKSKTSPVCFPPAR